MSKWEPYETNCPRCDEESVYQHHPRSEEAFMAIFVCANCGLDFDCVECGTQEVTNVSGTSGGRMECGQCGAVFWIDLDEWDESQGGKFR